MNTVITKLIDVDTDEMVGLDFNEELGDVVVESLVRNNAFMPNVERVIYNTKTFEEVSRKDDDGNVVKEKVGLEKPVLVTVVYFKDGTKVTVKNSDKDGITLVDQKVKLSDGSETTVRTASQESREIGLVYALVKRLVCGFDEGGVVQNAGFAKFLHKVVGDAYVQDVESVKTAAERRISKEAYKARAAKSEKKERGAKKNRGLYDIVSDLASTVVGLKDVVAKLVPSNADADSRADAE